MAETLRIATRGSRLALWQADWVRLRLEQQGILAELVVIETQGDREQTPFAQMQGQGFFTKAVQEAVLDGRADLAVHSYKDLPSEPVEGLEIIAVPQREDPRELLLVRPSAVDTTKAGLPLHRGIRVGSSAVRRQAQLHHLRPDLKLLELRGNVPTRVEKLVRGDCDAILLAYAGVKRLNLDLSELSAFVLEPDQLVPAPAQGALALEGRANHFSLKRLLRTLDDPYARTTVAAERGLMRRLAGGCQLALGATARIAEDGIELLAWYSGKRYKTKRSRPEEVTEAVYQLIKQEHPGAVIP